MGFGLGFGFGFGLDTRSGALTASSPAFIVSKYWFLQLTVRVGAA